MDYFRGITRNVFILGLVSFFTDMASEMLYPIIPLFLRGVLGVDLAALGWIEGLAEGISTGLRWIGGVLSDISGRRKPFIFWGYTISAWSKPVMGLSGIIGGWGLFLGGRAADRLGKSLRTAARDALIADATEEQHRGFAFGFHRAMDTYGAIAGPLLTMAVLLLFANVDLKVLFFIALGPGLISALLVVGWVREIPHTPSPQAARARAQFWQRYTPAFRRLVLAQVIFSLGDSSDSFLILRSVQMALGDTIAPSLRTQALFACGMFAAFNVFYAVLAAPAGKLSDRLGCKPLITGGWIVYAAVYAGFALLHAPWTPWLLFMVYGIYRAMAEGVSKALVTDLVKPEQKAGAIGLFYTVSGAAQLIGSVILGWVWQHSENSQVTWAFLLGTLFALLAVPIIATVKIPGRTTEGQLS